MRSLKQMCVLTIVALTGGTLGVGSTFGWWQNDKPSADAPPKTESTSSVSGVALSVDSPSAIETLIKQLEAESRENAEEGKKELVAQTQRVIERLQQILKSSREHEAVAVPPKSPNVGIRKGQPDGAKSASAAQSGFVYIERARKSEVVVSDPIIQELKGQPDNPNEIEAVRQKREAVIRSLEKLRQQASERENENHDAPRRLTITKLKQSGVTPTEIQILAGGPNLEEHLRQVADQLERSGQKDAARNIREGAERIQRDLRDTKVRNQAPRTQVDQVRVIEEEGSGLKRAVILRKIEAKPGEPAFYLQIDSDQGVQNSEKERRTKKNPD
ncbi:MAG: hypothetical protein JWM11_152, partial [Planctomycetaceae bacterium]|nr:hypothetical protein [Planctomycetaceae bacterium]